MKGASMLDLDAIKKRIDKEYLDALKKRIDEGHIDDDDAVDILFAPRAPEPRTPAQERELSPIGAIADYIKAETRWDRARFVDGDDETEPTEAKEAPRARRCQMALAARDAAADRVLAAARTWYSGLPRDR
jgi:hypothetical protein